MALHTSEVLPRPNGFQVLPLKSLGIFQPKAGNPRLDGTSHTHNYLPHLGGNLLPHEENPAQVWGGSFSFTASHWLPADAEMPAGLTSPAVQFKLGSRRSHCRAELARSHHIQEYPSSQA